MITFPNAKINIGLNILERREDGYHNIETIFYPIGLTDALELTESYKCENFSFNCSGLPIDAEVSNNLVTKAYQLINKDFTLPAIEVLLNKTIPFGAGLGGGSSDAAFMLKMLNEMFELKMTHIQLESYAARLGADCPFFIQNKPIFATGIGTIFEDVNISLKGYYIVLIKPNIHVSTPDAYAGVKPQKSAISLSEIIQHKPIHEWKNWVKNDFEKSVFLKYPSIEKIKNELYEKGAIYASMSGSGSSVFGIFEKEIENIDSIASSKDCFLWSGYLN